MKQRVVILGAGFAGLELTTRLSATSSDEASITLIDQSDSFIFGFSKLDVLFRSRLPDEMRLHYRDIAKPSVEFCQERITSIDPSTRHVVTDGGSYDADFLVVSLGADYDMAATPGFIEDGYEYYTVAGAERLRDALPSFTGGKVLISVLGEPYKCPPAPFEGALLLHDHLVERGIREEVDMRVTGYMDAPVPIAKQISEAILKALGERDIGFMPRHTVRSLDTNKKMAEFGDGESVPYDLFIGIPVHRVPTVVAESGLAEGGWIPVDKTNLATRFAGVYAVGDVAGAPLAKAGVFAESAARVVADDIAARIRDASGPPPFDGAGDCYIEFGGGLVGKVEANFLGGPSPTGKLTGPSLEIAGDKVEFARLRRERWFDS